MRERTLHQRACYLSRMLDTHAQKPARRPRFTRTGEVSFQLTERDIEIVRQVAKHRFIRSTHISALLDAPHKKICERLTSLYHAGYLDRPRSQLERHTGRGGSSSYAYAIGIRGARLIEGDRNVVADRNRKNDETTRHFLLHTLAITDVRVALTMACRESRNVRLQEPKQLLESAPEATRKSSKPWSWQVSLHHSGQMHSIGILPDYVFALLLPDGRRRPFVLECDRGTMPIERSSLGQSSLLRKFLAYEATRAQELHVTRFDWKAFRVLTVISTRERLENARDSIRRIPALRGSPLFLFAEHNALIAAGPLNYSWLGAGAMPPTLA
jgi:hypothetical protein